MSGTRRFFAHWGRVGRDGINSILGRAGLRLVRADTSLIDLTACDVTPIEARYRAALRPYVLNIPIEDCRILPGSGFACSMGVGNPFVDTLIEKSCGGAIAYRGSLLEGFYSSWQPRTAAEVLGVQGDTALASAPPLGFVMPWNSLTPAEAAARWQGFIDADNREHGGRQAHGGGWKSWGPVSDAVGSLEFGRLTKVFDSIKQDGYRRNAAVDGDIKGVVLHRSGDFRVLVTAGHHRAAALAATAARTAIVRIDTPMVRREDVSDWPNVRSGLFNEKQGLQLFDRLFDGRQPPLCRWP